MNDNINNENGSFDANVEQTGLMYTTLVDGTDISILDERTRKAIHGLSKSEVIQWYEAFEQMNDLIEMDNSGEEVNFKVGDYIFPDSEYHCFCGYIIQVREYSRDGHRYWYLDIVFGNDFIKTIRFEPTLLGDKISSAARKACGRNFTQDDLLEQLIRVKVINKKNKNGDNCYSAICDAQIIRPEITDILFDLYDAIV